MANRKTIMPKLFSLSGMSLRKYIVLRDSYFAEMIVRYMGSPPPRMIPDDMSVYRMIFNARVVFKLFVYKTRRQIFESVDKVLLYDH